MNEVIEQLRWKKYPVLDDGFICLVDVMGDDTSITQAARISYGAGTKSISDDTNLIRYLYRHGHTTPFEMVEFKFLVRCPMDCWRQWIRHRTANVNEYSTRYSEAIDSQQKTTEWRTQATGNRQGSAGLIGNNWPEGYMCSGSGVIPPDKPTWFPSDDNPDPSASDYLSGREADFQKLANELYSERLKFGVAREQARKDLPLSTYTEAYWKCDLKNILNFLSLRMDSHAQLEIRSYANAMYTIVKQVCPLAVGAFDEYDMRRGGLLLTASEVQLIRWLASSGIDLPMASGTFYTHADRAIGFPLPPTKCRERDEAFEKFIRMGMVEDV